MLGTETSSVPTDGRTERRTVCATRWEWAAGLRYSETQHGADARVSSSGRRWGEGQLAWKELLRQTRYRGGTAPEATPSQVSDRTPSNWTREG